MTLNELEAIFKDECLLFFPMVAFREGKWRIHYRYSSIKYPYIQFNVSSAKVNNNFGDNMVIGITASKRQLQGSFGESDELLIKTFDDDKSLLSFIDIKNLRKLNKEISAEHYVKKD